MAITGFGNGIPHWDDEPDAWDRLALGNIVMPGVWDIDFACERRIDAKKAKGKNGGKFTDLGLENAVIELNGKIATRAHLRDLQAIIETIHPRNRGKELKTYQLRHPKATFLGIGLVYITKVNAPRLENGIFSITINAIEYVAVPKTVKPSTSPPATGRNLLDQDKDITGVPVALKKP